MSQLPDPGARYLPSRITRVCSLSTLRPQRVLRGLRPLLPFELGRGGGFEMWEEFPLGRTQAETRIFGLCAQESALRPRFTSLARAWDRSSLHIVRKENNGRKAWFQTSTVSFMTFTLFLRSSPLCFMSGAFVFIVTILVCFVSFCLVLVAFIFFYIFFVCFYAFFVLFLCLS